MNAVLGSGLPTTWQQDYERARNLCFTALQGPAHEVNKAHGTVLALVPPGIYRSYKKRDYFVLGVRREIGVSRNEHYFVHMIPIVADAEVALIPQLLVGFGGGERNGWLYPAKKKDLLVHRYTLIKKISLSELARMAL